MKKLLFCLLLLLSFIAYAQEDESDSRIYVQRIFLDRIYEHYKGYVVTYGDLHAHRNEIALPESWFGDTYRAFAYLHEFHGAASPFMLVYFTDGEPSALHLYIPSSPLHPARKTLRNTPEVQDIFNIEPADLLF